MTIDGLRFRWSRRKLIRHERAYRESLRIYARGAALDGERSPKLQPTEHRAHGMASNVAQSAGSEFPPPPPLEGQVGGMIWPFRSGPEPQFPIQMVRNWRCVLRAGNTLWPVLIEK